MLTAMQDRNNCSQGISVQLWFKRPWSTRLSCTQHAFFAYINWFDHCLSQESIRKARHFECLGFLLLTDQIYFLLYLELRDEQKVSQRNLYCFPNSRSLTLKEHNTVDSTRICQHEDIWPIRALFQNLVSWNGGIKACLQATPTFPHSQPTTGFA